MANIIAIVQHKGGVGKTTTVSALGAGLAKLGKKVLLVDLDPQANLTQSFHIIEETDHIYNAMTGKNKLEWLEIGPNLSLIPSHIDLAGAEIELVGQAGREFILKELLDSIEHIFDYIIIDCPPSLGILTMNALVAAHEFYIVLQCQYLAFQGLNRLLEIAHTVQVRLNGELNFTGVIATMFDKRITLSKEVLSTIQEHFSDELFKPPVRVNTALAEAPAAGKDIFEYAPASNGAHDYMEICKEVLRRDSKDKSLQLILTKMI